MADAVVAIPVKNQKRYTYLLLLSLLDQGEVAPEQIVIYDNGSTDGTRELIEPLGVSVIDAAGCPLHRMWNEALSRASGAPVAILNNDISIGPHFISTMANALAEDPTLAVVCPKYDMRDAPLTYVTGVQSGYMDGSGGITGWAYMVAADWVEVFRFPEELRWWYGDNVLVDTAIREGRRCAIVGGTTAVHLDGGSRTGHWTAEMVDPDRIWYEEWRKKHAR